MFSFSKALGAAIICAVFAAPSVACAQVESTPAPMPSKPNFSSLRYLVGTWSCSTKSSRRPKAYPYTMTFTMDPGGWWRDAKTVTPGMAWFPHAATDYDKYTYDPSAKRWVDVSYGDYGSYGLATSAGPSATRIVWHAYGFVPAEGIKSMSDTTFVKVSNTKTTEDMWFVESGGRKVTVHSVCTKRL